MTMPLKEMIWWWHDDNSELNHMIMGVTMIVLNSDSVPYEMSTKSRKFTSQVVALCLSFCWSSHVSSSKYLKGHKSLESLFEHVHYYVCRYLCLCRCFFVEIVLGHSIMLWNLWLELTEGSRGGKWLKKIIVLRLCLDSWWGHIKYFDLLFGCIYIGVVLLGRREAASTVFLPPPSFFQLPNFAVGVKKPNRGDS